MKSETLFALIAALGLSGGEVDAQQAQGVAAVVDGGVSEITLLSGGAGYAQAPAVTLVGGGGYGAAAGAVVTNGTVTLITVQNHGAGYTAAPTVIVGPPLDFADGLIGWWRGELNTSDELGRNNGTVVRGIGYATGVVGNCFRIGPGYISLGTNELFDFDGGRGDFTIEAWGFLTVSPPNASTRGLPLVTKCQYGTAGWALYAGYNGGVGFATFPDRAWVVPAPLFSESVWYHVAVTQAGGVLSLFCNGQRVGSTNSSVFVASLTDVKIGSFGDDEPLIGKIDELSIYSRALRPEEIRAEYERGSQGKYLRPVLVGQPQTSQWYLGQSNALAVASIGSAPLSYQWSKNGVPIAGATNATLTFAATQFLDGGVYTATVWNSYGSATSPPATVTVTTAGLILGLVPKLTITGVTGRSYTVQCTTNLTEPLTWTTFTNLTLTVPVQVLYDFDTDTTAAGQPQRFYRVAPSQP